MDVFPVYSCLERVHRGLRHCGPLDGTTHRHTLRNPLCGDEVTVSAIVEKERVLACHFEGRGCALCRASASLLTEAVRGKELSQVKRLAEELFAFLHSSKEVEPDSQTIHRLGDMVALSGVREHISRRRCATLPWEAMLLGLFEVT